jgi:alpha-tubulin suppressor-like RCC1 family protein
VPVGSVVASAAATTGSNVPVDIAGLPAGATDLSAGIGFACAIANNSAWCWGNNDKGQLGNGTFTSSDTATEVVNLGADVTRIAAGDAFACAVAGGKAHCWGDNTSGQLGDGTTTSSNVPVAVIGQGAGIVLITAGGSHTASLTDSGLGSGWGDNGSGQVGDGTTENRTQPVDIRGLAPTPTPTATFTPTATATPTGTPTATPTPAHSLRLFPLFKQYPQGR